METGDKELHDMTTIIMFDVSKHLFWKQIGIFDRIFFNPLALEMDI